MVLQMKYLMLDLKGNTEIFNLHMYTTHLVYLWHLKCHYDEIFDIYFFTFSDRIALS